MKSSVIQSTATPNNNYHPFCPYMPNDQSCLKPNTDCSDCVDNPTSEAARYQRIKNSTHRVPVYRVK